MASDSVADSILRRRPGGRTLHCGCLVGDYQTVHGATVVKIDAAAPGCRAANHRVNAVLSMIGVIADSEGDAA